MKVILETRRAH